jgi:uncharacterized protein (TIGR02246 family)
MRIHLHRRLAVLIFLLLVLIPPVALSSQVLGRAPDEGAIRRVLDAQVTAWNRGDIDSFMQGYRNSDSTTFVSKSIRHGYANILERYRTAFSSKDKMGELAFTDLEIKPLDANFAIATGHYHLTRSAAAGGDAQGIFSLVFEKTSSGWKIILDHTC